MVRKLQSTPEWQRAKGTGPTIGVDREKEIIRGYIVAQEGPFKSEGRGEFDRQGLQMIVDLMRASPNGLKSRFAHPTLSDDGVGKFLGRVKNPRIDYISTRESEGAAKHDRIMVVRADLHLDPSAHNTPSGDLAEYVMQLAESDSDAFSSSLVLTTEKEYRIDSQGRPLKDADGNALPPLWYPKALHASDVVDTGDAVDGMLSADALPDGVVREASRLLDRQFGDAPRGVIEARCTRWLGRYLDLRYGPPEYDPSRDPELRRKLLHQAARRRRLPEDPEIKQIRTRRRRGRPALLPVALEGYALLWFNQGDDPRTGPEWLEPNCFAPTLSARKEVPALLRHNWDDHLASTAEGSLTIRNDSKGLWISLRPPNSDLGRRVVAQARAGRLNGCSPGYRPIKEGSVHLGGGRYLTRIERAHLDEISLTDDPVYEAGRLTVRDL